MTRINAHQYQKTARKLRSTGRSVGCEVGLLTLIFSMLAQCAMASSGAGTNRVDGPELVMDVTRRDFGEVFAGEELEQRFSVLNAGTKPLELSQKSALSSRSAVSRFPAAAALVLSGDQALVPTFAVMRTAPS